VDTETGELQERRLQHREEAEKFYRDLGAQGASVRVGMEASGHARWFERLLAELNFELWMGDAAEIRTKRVRKQKTDRQDAELILRLLLENRFPQVWVPSWENRDLRQLLWHRQRMVQARTRLMNQLQAVALNEGLRCKKRLWREAGRRQLESFRLAPWASRRRHDLLELLDRLNPMIAELTQVIEQEVEKCPEAKRLATHPNPRSGGSSFDVVLAPDQLGPRVPSFDGEGAASSCLVQERIRRNCASYTSAGPEHAVSHPLSRQGGI
jgi:transposase